ncbi:microsomal dipeptidase-like Zn-dependent dipeptidase [Streptomyces sp. TE33382]
MNMVQHPRRRLRSLTVVSLLVSVMALLLGPMPSSAAEPGWWTPAARPAPDSQINVTGEPFKGTDDQGRVRGFVDAHDHIMANEGFGGRLICGKPFSEQGVVDALKDCPEHYPDGTLAIFDFITKGGDGKHDPNGWPAFKDWPAHDSLTHQQNYYAWIERAWRGGQRVLVNDLVTNGVICSVYFFKDRGCDEMTAIRLEARKTYDMQAYIDKMYGGPGKGWFRIVTDSAQAREVIKQGKLAVVLGVETSEPFGCKQILDVAQCSRADIDRGLDELHELGVRSMFLCHKFDNALCGVRFDSGALGTAINVGQFLSTGTFWKTETCRGAQHDNPIGNAKAAEAEKKLPEGVAVPSYASGAQCNTRGLTDLGEYAVRGMMDRKMMLEIDHMSVKAAGQAFDILESESYPGIISSHSWMDLGWTERLYKLGGFVGQYMSGSEAFSAEAKRTDALREKYGVGYGYGTDMNGVGGWPGPAGRRHTESGEVPLPQHGRRLGDRQADHRRAHLGLQHQWCRALRHGPRLDRGHPDRRRSGRRERPFRGRRVVSPHLGEFRAAQVRGEPRLGRGRLGVHVAMVESARQLRARPGRGRRQGHSLGQRVERQPMAAHRPRIREAGQARHPRLGGGVREVVPDRTVGGRHELADGLVHDGW